MKGVMVVALTIERKIQFKKQFKAGDFLPGDSRSTGDHFLPRQPPDCLGHPKIAYL